MIDIIILDLFGTLTTGYDTIPRSGLVPFLEKYKEKVIVLATDAQHKAAEESLEKMGIRSYFSAIYGHEEMVPCEKTNARKKNLAGIVKAYNKSIKQAVFITDGANDLEDAINDGVTVIHIPYYWTHQETFSFAGIEIEEGKYHGM